MGIGWGALIVMGFAACGNGDEPAFDEDNVILDEDAIPATLADVQCEAQMACDCLTAAGPVGSDPEAYALAQCKEHRRLELEFWQTGAHYYGLTYDALCLARRLDAMKEVGCGDYTVWGGVQSDATCADRCRIYHGNIPAGSECDLEEGVDHCGQGLFCDWGWDETIDDYSGTCKAACRRGWRVLFARRLRSGLAVCRLGVHTRAERGRALPRVLVRRRLLQHDQHGLRGLPRAGRRLHGQPRWLQLGLSRRPLPTGPVLRLQLGLPPAVQPVLLSFQFSVFSFQFSVFSFQFSVGRRLVGRFVRADRMLRG